MLLVDGKLRISDWLQFSNPSEIQGMLSMKDTLKVSFALGLPDPELFPQYDMAEAAYEVLSENPNSLQYSESSNSLKKQIVELMRLRQVECSEEQIFLTAGSQQAATLLVQLLLNKNDHVITEKLLYTGFQQILAPFRPVLHSVNTSAKTGLEIEELEEMLRVGIHPSLIYCISDGHNPLGISMPLSARHKLIHLIHEFEIPVIEDDPYGLLNYEESNPPLKSLDENLVFYCGSFSKILAPSLRIGWIVLPRAVVHQLKDKLSIIKESLDLNTATFSQHVASKFLSKGLLVPHLNKLRDIYSKRRNVMLESLNLYMPSTAKWNTPTHGMFIWVELQNNLNSSDVLRRALNEYGIAFLPGRPFDVSGTNFKQSGMRLNFTNNNEMKIENGIKLLASVIKSFN